MAFFFNARHATAFLVWIQTILLRSFKPDKKIKKKVKVPRIINLPSVLVGSFELTL